MDLKWLFSQVLTLCDPFRLVNSHFLPCLSSDECISLMPQLEALSSIRAKEAWKYKIYYRIKETVKVHLDYSCIFIGPPNIHLSRSIIVKVCAAGIDSIEDMAEKKISPPRSDWVAIHDGKNMASGVTISCLGDGSYIGDHKFI